MATIIEGENLNKLYRVSLARRSVGGYEGSSMVGVHVLPLGTGKLALAASEGFVLAFAVLDLVHDLQNEVVIPPSILEKINPRVVREGGGLAIHDAANTVEIVLKAGEPVNTLVSLNRKHFPAWHKVLPVGTLKAWPHAFISNAYLELASRILGEDTNRSALDFRRYAVGEAENMPQFATFNGVTVALMPVAYAQGFGPEMGIGADATHAAIHAVRVGVLNA